MNRVEYAFLISLIAGLATLIGYIFIFIKIKDKNKLLTFCLGISVSILIMISIIDLLPKAILTIYKHFLIIGLLFILILFIISYLLVKLINKIGSKNKLYKLGITSMIILIIHNIPEGIITYITSTYNINIGMKIASAITIHNIPEGFMIALPIYYGTNKKVKAFIYTFIAGMSEPLGALLSYLFISKYITDIRLSVLYGITGFIMIILAIEQIFAEAIKLNRNKELIIGIALGVGLFITSILI